MVHTVKVENGSFITLPEEIVTEFDLKEGDEIKINDRENGILELVPQKMTDVEIDLPDEVLFKLMTMAHEQDITLNQLVNNILRDEMNKLDQEKRISINDLQKKKKIDKMIKAVEDGQTFIICEDDECLKPISVIMPIDKYNALKSM